MPKTLQAKTIKPKVILVAILAAYAMPQMAFAENKAEALELSKVEVVGTTPLPSIGTPINQVPSNVQTGSSKSIDQQQSLDLSEYLDNNLGSVNTSNSVANPYQADVQFRGFTASPLLGTPQGLSVYLDGVRVNEAFGDIVNWDLIPANAIANINLIPGSNPLFGLNTLGGALAVHTKSGTEFPGVKATVYGGSWARRAFEFEAGGVDKEKNLDYFVAGNIFKENGWREHSSSDVKQIFGKVGWQNDTSDLDLSIALADTMMEGTQAVPLSTYSNPKQAYTYPDSIGNQMVMLNLKGSHFLTDDKLVAGNVYYRKNRSKGFNSNANSTAAADSSNVSSTTDQDGFGGALQFTLLGNLAGYKNQFTVGASADFGRTNFNSDSLQATVVGNQTVTDTPELANGIVRLKTRNDYYGLYATDMFSFNDKLHMTLSGRYNVAKINLAGYSDNIDNTVTPAAHSVGDLNGNHHYNRFNPAIGFNYNPSNSIGFYGGYNEGMRAATPVELSCADSTRPCALPNAFAADPHLEKVVAKTWEGGVRGKLADNASWNAALYSTENSNDIQFISTGATGFGYFNNVGQTRRRGIELGFSGKFDALILSANYGFVDATYQSDFTVGSPSNTTATAGIINVSKGDKIPGIARHTLKLRAAYDVTPSWNIGTNVVVSAGQFARGDENNQDVNGKVPGYAVVHLDTHYSLNDNWKMFAKVNNVFDTQYATFGVLGGNIFNLDGGGNPINEQFRSPAAPRAAWVGLTYEFGRSKTASAAVDHD